MLEEQGSNLTLRNKSAPGLNLLFAMFLLIFALLAAVPALLRNALQP